MYPHQKKGNINFWEGNKQEFRFDTKFIKIDMNFIHDVLMLSMKIAFSSDLSHSMLKNSDKTS